MANREREYQSASDQTFMSKDILSTRRSTTAFQQLEARISKHLSRAFLSFLFFNSLSLLQLSRQYRSSTFQGRVDSSLYDGGGKGFDR